MNFIEAVFTHSLLRVALLAGLFSSIVSGVIGSYVIIKRIVFISGSIAHAVLGGIGFCLWLERARGYEGISPIAGALAAAVLSALLLGWIHLHYRQREDSIIAALWSVGMATGVLFISQTPGFNLELTNFLIGNILWVSNADLLTLGILDLFILVIVFLFHKQFHVICFDEDQAYLQGIHVERLYILLLVLIAVSVVLLIQVVGIILVIAMLTIPPTIANFFTHRLPVMMALAVGISALFSTSGIFLAYHCDWPTGATIALVAGGSYIVLLVSTKKTS